VVLVRTQRKELRLKEFPDLVLPSNVVSRRGKWNNFALKITCLFCYSFCGGFIGY
jgi:hypothetical protein